MRHALALLPTLVGTTNHISNMIFTTSGTVLRDPTDEILIHPRQLKNLQKVKLLSVKRREKNKRVVLSRREKFNMVKAEMEPVAKALQRLSSAKFYARIEQLHTTFGQLLLSWNEEDQATDDTDADVDEDVADVASDGYFSMYGITADKARDPVDERESALNMTRTALTLLWRRLCAISLILSSSEQRRKP
jgi:hypothetical protein